MNSLVNGNNLSVIIGGLITLVATFITAVLNRRQQHRALVEETKKNEYMAAIDALCSVRTCLKDLCSTVSGRKSEMEAQRESDLEESIRRDQEGAAYVEMLYKESSKLDCIEEHLRVYGSKEVIAAYTRVEDDFNSYIRRLYSEAITTGRFIASDYNDAVEQFNADLKTLERIINADLGIY